MVFAGIWILNCFDVWLDLSCDYFGFSLRFLMFGGFG